ncbi:MAG: hypothetical protein HN522_00090 [Flavobacteriales bacterium]|jgi:hypothetical protein|nr:hypothetical protein [Flavobacteriales bacterium]
MEINSDFPIMYSIACLFLGLSYAYFLYRKEFLLTAKKLKQFLFIIRTFFITLLAVLLLNPVVKSIYKTKHKPIVILAQDISESITDSFALQFLTQISKQLTDFEVHEFSFSDNVSKGFSSSNNGLTTDYSNLFQDMNNRFANQNIAGLVLATDGLYNSGSNPLYDNRINFPIYPIAQGDTLIKRDLSITKVLKNEIAFLGNIFPLEITLSAQQCKGENIQVEIWNKGKKIHAQSRIISTDDEYQKVKINLLAEDVGLQHYTIAVSQLFNEKNSRNNNYTIYVEVIDSRYKILLLTEKTHPDVAAYKNAIEKNKNYTVEQVNIIDFNGSFEAYQLIVIFGIQKNNILLTQLEKAKVPLLVFDIQQNSNLEFTSFFNFKSRGGLEEVKAVKSEFFSKFTFSPELLNLIQYAPPLQTPFGKYTLQIGSEVVIAQQIGMQVTSKPIILINETNGRKLAFITAEGFWKWKLYNYANAKNNVAFDELFSKLTQYLVLQEDKSKFRIDYKKQFAENSNIYFEASLYNESYELINDKEISIVIQNEKGDEFDYEFSKSPERYNLNVGVLDVGKYTFLAKAKGSKLIRKGSFDVRAIQLEQLYTVANHKLLFQLANSSGGKLFYPNQSNKIITAIKKSKNNFISVSSKEKLKGMINISLILLSLLILISLEWFLRKYNGLI